MREGSSLIGAFLLTEFGESNACNGFRAPPIIRMQSAHVAQLAERVLGKDKVTGSNPVVGSTKRDASEGIVNRAQDLDSRFLFHEATGG